MSVEEEATSSHTRVFSRVFGEPWRESPKPCLSFRYLSLTTAHVAFLLLVLLPHSSTWSVSMGGFDISPAASTSRALAPSPLAPAVTVPSQHVLELAGVCRSAFVAGPADWLASEEHKTALLKTCEEWVKTEIASCDASHDWCHVHRVRLQAIAIAREEELEAKLPGALVVVELAALLHDVKDYKYSGSDTAGIEAAAAFLKTHTVPPAFIARILEVIDNVSYKKELSSLPTLSAGECLSLGPVTELACVQDADRYELAALFACVRACTFYCSHCNTSSHAHIHTGTHTQA